LPNQSELESSTRTHSHAAKRLDWDWFHNMGCQSQSNITTLLVVILRLKGKWIKNYCMVNY
jgi:hypothetical protein